MKVLVKLFLLIPVFSFGQEIHVDFETDDLSGWYSPGIEHWCIAGDEALEGFFSLGHCFDNDEGATEWIAFVHDPLLTDSHQSRWEFSIRYAFAPSANNNWAVFLSHHSLPDKEGRLPQGIIIGVNYTGNSDELKVWYADEGEITELLNSGFNWQERIDPSQAVGLCLNQTETGTWSFQLDSGTGWEFLGEFSEMKPDTINIFSISYRYTSTLDQGFWFDDLNISGDFSTDRSAPYVASIAVLSPHEIEVSFNEPVQLPDAGEWCVGGVGCLVMQSDFGRDFRIALPHALIPKSDYILTLPKVSDLYGNYMDNNALCQSFHYPGPYEVVINEIMADPSPAVLLPEAEYLELFNVSESCLVLTHWQMQINQRRVPIPDCLLRPGDYILLTDRENVPLFDGEVSVVGLENFPSLNNSGASVILSDASGCMIHALAYTSDWHDTPEATEGGWSLEMIDPYAPCSDDGNWSTSRDYRGGTPSRENSVMDVHIKNEVPQLWRVAVTESGSLMLYFSEPMDSLSLMQPAFYRVDRGIGTPTTIEPAWPMAYSVELHFAASFEAGVEYEIQLTSDITDCSGNTVVHPASRIFRCASPADSGDVIVNEILYDPLTGYNEFVELYNTTDKTIDVRNFRLAVGEAGDSGRVVTTEYWPLDAKEYAIISTGHKAIDDPGTFHNPDRIVFMPDMPGLVNSGSDVFLFSSIGVLSDMISYSPDSHHDILFHTKGVSLERISTERPGIDQTNWISASSDAGYMTPAARNSQHNDAGSLNNVELNPYTITPDGDGMDDRLYISYVLDNEGYMGQVFVYDTDGRKRNTIADGVLLGTTGIFTFDGEDQYGDLLEMGYYILFFRAYHPNGKKHTEKLSFVLISGQRQ